MLKLILIQSNSCLSNVWGVFCSVSCIPSFVLRDIYILCLHLFSAGVNIYFSIQTGTFWEWKKAQIIIICQGNSHPNTFRDPHSLLNPLHSGHHYTKSTLGKVPRWVLSSPILSLSYTWPSVVLNTVDHISSLIHSLFWFRNIELLFPSSSNQSGCLFHFAGSSSSPWSLML